MQPSDLNSDGVVDVIDLSILVSRWGSSDVTADINSDGVVDALDLSTLVSNWGAVSSGLVTALLVTNESVLSAGNQVLYDRLVLLGYSVVLRLDSDPVDYSGIDVIVTGSITGSSINGKYANPDVGVVCVDSWPHFGLGSSIGFENNVTDVEVINDSSPLAGGLSSGIHTVYGTAGYLVWSTNYNAATATVVATNPGNPTQPIVFGYEAGSMMASEYATTRHVGLGLHKDVRADLTAAGWALFDAAVAWAAASAYVAPPPPSAPTNLSATAGDMQVSLSWNSVAGATSYSVKRSTSDGGPYSTVVSGHTTTSYIDSSLTNGSTYYYVVSASNAEGESSNSVQVSAVPVEGGGTPSGNHFYATDAEITEWQSRMVNGPYRVAGDVSANSPGDWERIDTNAENFRANPSAGRWIQPGTGYIVQNDPWPGGSGSGISPNEASRFMDAAFKGMLTGDTDLKDKVKTELLWQIREPSFSSLNYARWDPNYPGFWPSPMFALSRHVQRWFTARDYLGRSYFTDGENEELDRWFYGHANYFVRILDAELTKAGRYPNRWNEDWSTWTLQRSSTIEAWEGGPGIDYPALMYNNRQSSIGVVPAVIAPYLKHYGYVAPTSGGPSYGFRTVDELVQHGWIWFNEILISTVFPGGYMGDFERTMDSNPTLGRDYSMSLMGVVSEIADAHARIGDLRPYQLTTTLGFNGSEGSPSLSGFSSGKSLLFLKTFMLKYGDGSTYSDRTQNGQSLYAPEMVADSTSARANLYYKDDWLKSAYLRTATGFQTYPSSPASLGPWGSSNAWRGEQNHTVGLLFLYGQMEDVNVYPGM